jgi:dynamin 1-like protein
MSSVIADKEAREKKAIQDAERKKREQKRLKELNGANGAETPEDGEEGHKVADKALPLRKHQTQTSRSMSPAVGRLMNGSHNSISGQLSNRNRSPPPMAASGNARDGFLNYFFGKDGGAAHNPSLTLDNRPGSRHVSQNIEPSFAQSIRRGDPKAPSPMVPSFNMDDDEEPSSPAEEIQGGFVSSCSPQFADPD